MIGDALYIAARAPRPGFTKSRLGRIIGQVQAATLYAAFLRDLATRFAHAPFAVGWYVTPEDAWPELAPLVEQTDRRGAVIPQGPGDWTERQRALFAAAGSRGEARTVLIASDSPQLEVAVIIRAFEQLADHDLVFGPTIDGGYYLIGMRTGAQGAARRPWEVLSGVRMSTGTVLDELCTRADALGLSASLLPVTFDIDEVDDLDLLTPLALLRPDLSSTRSALLGLGLVSAETVAAHSAAHALPVGGRR
jgi:rSAM/selenodomain-associated transferase 1